MDNEDGLDIPDFLRLTAQERRDSWKGVRLTTTQTKVKGVNYALPKTMEPEAVAMLKQVEKDKAARTEAKFVKLREKAKR